MSIAEVTGTKIIPLLEGLEVFGITASVANLKTTIEAAVPFAKKKKSGKVESPFYPDFVSLIMIYNEGNNQLIALYISSITPIIANMFCLSIGMWSQSAFLNNPILKRTIPGSSTYLTRIEYTSDSTPYESLLADDYEGDKVAHEALLKESLLCHMVLPSAGASSINEYCFMHQYPQEFISNLADVLPVQLDKILTYANSKDYHYFSKYFFKNIFSGFGTAFAFFPQYVYIYTPEESELIRMILSETPWSYKLYRSYPTGDYFYVLDINSIIEYIRAYIGAFDSSRVFAVQATIFLTYIPIPGWEEGDSIFSHNYTPQIDVFPSFLPNLGVVEDHVYTDTYDTYSDGGNYKLYHKTITKTYYEDSEFASRDEGGELLLESITVQSYILYGSYPIADLSDVIFSRLEKILQVSDDDFDNNILRVRNVLAQKDLEDPYYYDLELDYSTSESQEVINRVINVRKLTGEGLMSIPTTPFPSADITYDYPLPLGNTVPNYSSGTVLRTITMQYHSAIPFFSAANTLVSFSSIDTVDWYKGTSNILPVTLMSSIWVSSAPFNEADTYHGNATGTIRFYTTLFGDSYISRIQTDALDVVEEKPVALSRAHELYEVDYPITNMNDLVSAVVDSNKIRYKYGTVDIAVTGIGNQPANGYLLGAYKYDFVGHIPICYITPVPSDPEAWGAGTTTYGAANFALQPAAFALLQNTHIDSNYTASFNGVAAEEVITNYVFSPPKIQLYNPLYPPNSYAKAYTDPANNTTNWESLYLRTIYIQNINGTLLKSAKIRLPDPVRLLLLTYIQEALSGVTLEVGVNEDNEPIYEYWVNAVNIANRFKGSVSEIPAHYIQYLETIKTFREAFESALNTLSPELFINSAVSAYFLYQVLLTSTEQFHYYVMLDEAA